MNIKLIIDRIENGQAVLKTDDNQTIIWPTSKLPEPVAEGEVLNLSINSGKEQNNKQLAKDILNEILDTNN
ncbi:MAG: DUF3006 domain-containing protein [Candidatus Magasanikbacteria bacterium]|nr:DUF3006 domain-containing protein [Candidatus Magasanikbacteria bacterium]